MSTIVACQAYRVDTLSRQLVQMYPSQLPVARTVEYFKRTGDLVQEQEPIARVTVDLRTIPASTSEPITLVASGLSTDNKAMRVVECFSGHRSLGPGDCLVKLQSD